MILLLGGKGSIGRRYAAVLRELGEPFIVHDKEDNPQLIEHLAAADHAIIATPTETHFDYILTLERARIPYLCEKPVTKKIAEAEMLFQHCSMGFVVNNWAFLSTNAELTHTGKLKHLTYDFYNTGRDGLLWDVCQLVYLAQITQAKLEVRRFSASWDVTWNDFEVPYRWIEMSYLQMVRAFLENDPRMLWNMKRGCEMTKTVHRLIEKAKGEDYEGFNWDPAKDEFEIQRLHDL